MISGSLECKAEYDTLKGNLEKAIEFSSHNFNKKRGMTQEMKAVKEAKAEAERYKKLLSDKVKNNNYKPFI